MAMQYRIVGLMMILICGAALAFPPASHPQATLYIGDGSGDPGSCATPVEVSLENATVEVKGISMDICEVNNTLVRLGCDTTPRTPAFTGGGADFNCISNELSNGCVRILLYSGQGSLIDRGSGPVFAIKYGVFEEAGPAGSCIQLTAQNVLVAGESGPIANVSVLSGQFCYFECSVDVDCSDGAYCNGIEACVTGACQSGINPCPDDGLFCTGGEGCDEVANACTQSGNPCKIACDEINDVCLCSVDEDCNDGIFCNGAETCNGTFCLLGTNPCPPPSICDEDNDRCVECAYDSDCNDEIFCNGAETCVAGSCQAGTSPCPPLSTCDEANDVCLCTENAQCNDGLYCNGVERCRSNGTCDITFSYFSDYPCKDCTPTLDDCDCDESIDACLPVNLAAGDGSGAPGTTGNTVAVSLNTLFVDVNTVQVDICDVDDYITCADCEPAGRTPDGFGCLFAEQPNGCCRITLIAFSGDVIEPGAGPIFNLVYTVDAGAPTGECRALNLQNEVVATANVPLDVNTAPGQFCFGIAGNPFASSGGAGGSTLFTARNAGTGGSAGVIPGGGSGTARSGTPPLRDAGEGQEGGQTFLKDSDTCPLVAAVDDQEQITTLRSFRDNILSKNIVGQIFTHLFYRNTAELTELLKQHDEISDRIRVLVDEYSPLIEEVAGGGTICLPASDRENMVTLLKDIQGVGSPQLRADIDLVLAELVSGTMEELFGILVEK
jgi:hypothetical protein